MNGGTIQSFAIGVAVSMAASSIAGPLGNNISGALGAAGSGFIASTIRGAIVGGLAGGISSSVMGGSFIRGFGAGALGGAIGAASQWEAAQAYDGPSDKAAAADKKARTTNEHGSPTDRTPDKMVILSVADGDNGNKFCTYGLENAEGEALRGPEYSIAEWINPDLGPTANSNGQFSERGGEFRDNVWNHSPGQPAPLGVKLLVQQFSVKFGGAIYNLHTVFLHVHIATTVSTDNMVIPIFP